MNLKLIVVIFVIATMPVCAEAQTSDNATVTHARNILKNYQRRQGQDPDLLRYG